MYKQSGRNDKYPDEIVTWRFGETIPDWLSDACKIKFIDGEGNKTLETRSTNTGGIEFVNSEGTGVVVKMRNKKDILCYDQRTKRIFSLNPIQLSLLYKEVITKK